jgi:hypothetical protein
VPALALQAVEARSDPKRTKAVRIEGYAVISFPLTWTDYRGLPDWSVEMSKSFNFERGVAGNF